MSNYIRVIDLSTAFLVFFFLGKYLVLHFLSTITLCSVGILSSCAL